MPMMKLVMWLYFLQKQITSVDDEADHDQQITPGEGKILENQWVKINKYEIPNVNDPGYSKFFINTKIVVVL